MLDQLHQPPAEIVARAHVNADRYAAMYAASVADPDAFWGEHGRRLDWIKPYTRVKNTSFAYPTSRSNGSRTASSTSRPTASTATSPPAATRPRSSGKATTPRSSEHITYRQLHAEVSKFANVLHSLGVRKGDRVVLYLPMIPQAAYAMLACARIGAVHSVVFAGFSAEALRSRIEDSGAKLVITADEAPRGGRRTPLKANADKARRRFPRRAPARRQAHRRRRALGRRPRRLAARGRRDRRRPLRAGGDGRRGPALHPLHLRLHRPAQGRAAHHRRLPRLCRR